MEKYFDYMKTRNLHFIVGTESRYNKYLIIGLYYPPKINKLLYKPTKQELDEMKEEHKAWESASIESFHKTEKWIKNKFKEDAKNSPSIS